MAQIRNQSNESPLVGIRIHIGRHTWCFHRGECKETKEVSHSQFTDYEVAGLRTLLKESSKRFPFGTRTGDGYDDISKVRRMK